MNHDHCMHACVYVCMCTYVRMFICTCTYTVYIYRHISQHVDINIHEYIYDREAFRVYLTYAFCIKHMNLFKYFQ